VSSRPMKVPAAAKAMATATRNSTCPIRVVVLAGAASVGLAWVGREKALGSCKVGSVDVGSVPETVPIPWTGQSPLVSARLRAMAALVDQAPDPDLSPSTAPRSPRGTSHRSACA
jgi:hypothetical protein